jgi:hypothetical protein
MQTQRTIDEAPTAQSESPLAIEPVVAQRSARRATARRASRRRATARRRRVDAERGVIDYLKDHPGSTTGDIAKGLNADRGTIAGVLSRIRGAGDAGGRRA